MTAPQDSDLTIIAQRWLADLEAVLSTEDANAFADLLYPDGVFRDVLTFTWNVRSLEGREKIIRYLADKLLVPKVSKVKLSDDQYFLPQSFSPGPNIQGVEFGYTYETTLGHGQGYTRLVKGPDGGWKAVTVAMIIMDLKGHEEPTGRYYFEDLTNGKTWDEYIAEQRQKWETEPTAIIVGGGHNGLQTSARFKQMGIAHILVEKEKRIGDNWRKRYASLTLHTLKEQHQLLYQPLPTNWPIFAPRNRVANMLETYAITQELPVWTNSFPTGRPVYDEKKRRWTITINRDGKDIILCPKHIVLATGTLGAPFIPKIENRGKFAGTVIHSSQYNEPSPFVDQHVVVVGAANSAVDICQDLAERGAASVTMIQRSPVLVTDRNKENIGYMALLPPDVPTAVTDFKVSTISKGYVSKTTMAPETMKYYWEVMNKDVVEKVQKGGFMVEKSKSQVSLWYERWGGYWMDKGASDLIASGAIKIKPGVEVKALTEKTVVLSDGSHLQADTVIYATGYVDIRESNRQLFGAEVIDKTSEVLGLDEEGELRGSFRPSGHPGLWYAVGDFMTVRPASKWLGILILASEHSLLDRLPS